MRNCEKVWKLKNNFKIKFKFLNKFYDFLMKRWKMNQIKLILWYLYDKYDK